MYASIMILSALLSVLVCIVTTWLFVLLVQRYSRNYFFTSLRSAVSGGSGRVGISLLCFDNGDLARLENLLAAESPDYEVIMVANSLQNPESLHAITERYHMVVVDSRIFAANEDPRVRRMYRSASRCFRRLILLDVATADRGNDDLDVAYKVATYDFLLPLWGAERLQRGAIERVVTELSAIPDSASRVFHVGLYGEFMIIPAKVAQKCGGVSTVKCGSLERCNICRQVVCCGDSVGDKVGQIIASVLWVGVAACGSCIVADVAMEAACVALFTLLFIMCVAYASSKLLSCGDNQNVGYGATLYLFYTKLLPEIWQIRK